MASPVYADPEGPLRLAVLADSLAFTGPAGPLLPEEPRLYPNVAARRISDAIGRKVSVWVLAHPGSGVRDSWYAVTKDRHVMFEILMRADAVIVGIGSFDHAPAGVPPLVDTVVKALPQPEIRRLLRSALRAVHPWGARLTRGRFTRVGAAEFERLYDQILFHVRSLTWGAPAVALGPTSHRSSYYGHVHPQHAARVALERRVATAHSMPFVESWPHVEPFAGKLNPDGIHWPFESHEIVGTLLGDALLDQLTGRMQPPGIPGFEDTV